MLSGSVPAGGRATFRIRLSPVQAISRNATLEVNCAIGKVPAEHQTEGIRLAFEEGGSEFDQEVSGRALFSPDEAWSQCCGEGARSGGRDKPCAN